MKKAKFVVGFLFTLLVFVGCPADSATVSSDTQPPSGEFPEQSSVTDQKQTNDDVKTDSDDGGNERKPSQNKLSVSLEKAGKSQTDTSANIERKIIRNANLQLEVGSPEKAQQKITAIADSKKGFVVQSRKTNSSIRNRGGNTVSMTIRIPADKFTESLDEIRKAASRVIDESITGRDVTEEFIDIEARLKTRKALEERFLEIMKTSKSVQDALNVQRQLANVRGEIERIEGRKRFLANQASLSTIKVTLQIPTAISGSSSGFFYELKEAASVGFGFALTFILYLVSILIGLIPFLVLIVLPVFLVLRYFWRKYKTKRIAKKFVEEELKDE